MKKVNLLLLALVLVAAGFMAGRWRGAAPGGAAQASRPKYQCPMHPAVIQDHPGDCPICGMRPVPVQADGGPAGGGAPRPAGTVTTAADKRQLQGVRLGTVERRAARHALRLFGRVVPDERRVHTLNAAMPGSVRRLSEATTGSPVRQGQWLGAVFMLEARAGLQAYITALDVVDMDPRTRADEGVTVTVGTTPSKSAQFGEERLRSYGVSQRQIDEMRHKREIPLTIDLYSPVDGYLLERNVSLNQRFEMGATWFRVANLDKVWILVDLPDADVPFVRAGQKARVTLPGRPGVFEATVSAVPATFDAESRTLKLRLEVDNPGAVLRPDMFVDAELDVDLPEALTVPVDAVVDGGQRKTVFVEKGEGVFEPRRVETGWRFGDHVEIVKGLAAGDRIVVSGTFLVDSESQMKAAANGLFGEPATDPVCGMEVDVERARAAGKTLEHEGTAYFFCSDQCRKDFAASPATHLAKARGAPAGAPAGPHGGAAAPAAPAAGRATGHEGHQHAGGPGAGAPVTDPVCGMSVDPASAVEAGRTLQHAGATWYFCSDPCRKRFEASPQSFTAPGAHRPAGGARL